MGFCYCSLFCCALLCVHSSFAIKFGGEERAGCFALFVFLVSRDCCVALPQVGLDKNVLNQLEWIQLCSTSGIK